MKDIVVFSLEDCPHCVELKEHLHKNKVVFEECAMDSAEGITEMRFNGCFAMVAPVLKVKDNFYEVDDLFPGGKLDENKTRDLTRQRTG